jgi:hypothetical protein
MYTIGYWLSYARPFNAENGTLRAPPPPPSVPTNL